MLVKALIGPAWLTASHGGRCQGAKMEVFPFSVSVGGKIAFSEEERTQSETQVIVLSL